MYLKYISVLAIQLKIQTARRTFRVNAKKQDYVNVIVKALDEAKDGKKKYIPVSFYGAPSPADIARAAYGENADEKLVSQTIERLLACITEGKYLPRDIMLSAARRADSTSTGRASESKSSRRSI